jgi:uncharacterized protein YjiK
MQTSRDHTISPFQIKLHNLLKPGFRYILRFISLLLLFAVGTFCKSGNQTMITSSGFQFEYDLDHPDEQYKLPSYLEEISGLSYYGKGKVACVQDEKANIYVLNLEKEKIIKKIDFGEDADYEDIAIKNKDAYVLRANGHIYRVKDFNKKERKVKKYNTPLKEKNDTEGIAYDPLSNALLVACKGSPSIDKENKYEGYKAVYKFDLEEKELISTPHFLVDLENLDSYQDRTAFKRLSLNVAKRLRLIESETSFQPSGIAVHPLYNEIYIISSVGKLLIVLNRRGKVLDVQNLDPITFRQPEGICFSPSGDMFISNEGKGGKGYILKFKLPSNENHR